MSEDSILQLYKRNFEEPNSIEVAESAKMGGNVSIRAGLSKILSLVSGVNAKGQGSVEGSRSKSQTKVFEDTKWDQMLSMLDEIFNSEEIPDISEIEDTTEPVSESLISFSVPVEVSTEPDEDISIYQALKWNEGRDGQPVMIRVTHQSDDLYITGVTSPENWISRSGMVNIFESGLPEASENTMDEELSGVLHPIHIRERNGTTIITAQYLFLSPGSVQTEWLSK
ncbi:hypothetical protein [Halobaculum roseum]|uniref:Uncharacterized protein n=1 Tax=Halobaculum roseum TaxID=2175149 RepID=A0ABD5MKK5_9EURY|nr:hypothetical protein [Halobaculum roseum]QZY03211.1 hypothetical protein K6T36_03235 [Halobaculum roseum]